MKRFTSKFFSYNRIPLSHSLSFTNTFQFSSIKSVAPLSRGYNLLKSLSKFLIPVGLFYGIHTQFSKVKAAEQKLDEETMKQIKEKAEQILKDKGEISKEGGNAYYNLGRVMLSSGNLEEALKYYEKTLEIAEKVYGKDTHEYATVITNIFEIWILTNNPKRAIEKMNEAIVLKRKSLGENHPRISWCHYNLGGAYYTINDMNKAIEHFKAAYEILKKSGDKTTMQQKIICLIHLGQSYSKAGDKTSAIKAWEEAKKESMGIYGEKHPLIENIQSEIKKLQ